MKTIALAVFVALAVLARPPFRRSKTPSIAVFFSDIAAATSLASRGSRLREALALGRRLLAGRLGVRIKLFRPTPGLFRFQALPLHLFIVLTKARLLLVGLSLESLRLHMKSLRLGSLLLQACRFLSQLEFAPFCIRELVLRLRAKPLRLNAVQSAPPLAPLPRQRDRQNRHHENSHPDHDPHPQRHPPREFRARTSGKRGFFRTTRMTLAHGGAQKMPTAGLLSRGRSIRRRPRECCWAGSRRV